MRKGAPRYVGRNTELCRSSCCEQWWSERVGVVRRERLARSYESSDSGGRSPRHGTRPERKGVRTQHSVELSGSAAVRTRAAATHPTEDTAPDHKRWRRNTKDKIYSADFDILAR